MVKMSFTYPCKTASILAHACGSHHDSLLTRGQDPQEDVFADMKTSRSFALLPDVGAIRS